MRNPIDVGASRRSWMPPPDVPSPVAPPAASPGPVGLTLRWEVAFYAALLAVALLMRVWELGDRAFHHDESLHALYSWYVSEGRGYTHNPLLHGPLQYHLNALVFFLFGDSNATARVAYALAGTGLAAMPWLLRDRLGRGGAIAAASLLAFSPTLLYFSRFARNDILMAVLTLAMAVVVFRYLQRGGARRLYALAALLALSFAAKETVYIFLVGLGAFLAFLSVGDVRGLLLGRLRLSELGRPASALLVLVTLSLPLAGASTSLAQGALGLTLSNSDPTAGVVGMPLEGGRYAAVAVTVALLAASAALGLAWRPRQWLICAAVFAVVWLLLFTSFFSSPYGAVTGAWQSLGYWLAQQDVGRGSQPWYYYFVIGGNYEFLAAGLAVAGAAWHVARGRLLTPADALLSRAATPAERLEALASPRLFTLFLLVWLGVSFVLFTAATERMPWLLVHLIVPAALLGGQALAAVIARAPWRRLAASWTWLGLAAPALALLAAYRLLFYEAVPGSEASAVSLAGLLAMLAAAVAAGAYAVRRLGRREGLAVVGVGLAALLLALGVRAGWTAAFENGETPVEMLVYTQTSPDVERIARDVARIAAQTGQGRGLAISVDGKDGYSWPWAWYLRDYDSVGYPNYSGPDQPVNSSGVVLVHADNDEAASADLRASGFTQAQRYKHRWWFPESYRGLTPGVVWDGVRSREAWRNAASYWLFREFETPLGSVDGYLYYGGELEGRYPAGGG